MNKLNEKKLAPVPSDPLWLKFIFGGLSCMTAACFTNPVDVIKTRLQLQGQLGAKFRGYNGMFQGLAKIASEEGMKGLYQGITASLLRESIYSTIRMGSYEPFKNLLGATDPANTPLWQKFAAGGLAGSFGSALANPTDLIKVRFQGVFPGDPQPYRSTLSAFGEVYRKEGIKGLYRGVVPNTQRAIILTASQLTAYDHFKHYVLNNELMDEGTSLHLVSSMFAGLVCALTTAPVDNIKTRIMTQKNKGDLYKNSWDCLVKTVRIEGIFGLYKGFTSQWMRIGPHTIVAFVVFERLRSIFGMTAI